MIGLNNNLAWLLLYLGRDNRAGIRGAYHAFVQHLRNDGITALEAAMGQKAARPVG